MSYAILDMIHRLKYDHDSRTRERHLAANAVFMHPETYKRLDRCLAETIQSFAPPSGERRRIFNLRVFFSLDLQEGSVVVCHVPEAVNPNFR